VSTFIIRRVLIAIPLLWGVLTLTFISVHLIPGDPAQVMLYGRGTAADVARLRHELGLDQPLLVQYWQFMVNSLHLDFGTSIRTHETVWYEITQRAPATFQLTAVAMLMSLVFGLVTGIMAALLNRTFIGAAITGFSVAGISVPDFWLGTMLALVFGVKLGWLPVSGPGDWTHIILPALTLAIGVSAILTRLIRASLVEVLDMEYLRTAKAKGLRKRVIVYKHALKNALIPVVTIFGLTVASLLSGVVIIENVFSWPGLGTYAVSAVQARDFPAVEGTTFFFAVILIIANLLVDVSYGFLDPRIKFS
jgi:ABC-type dipeptide/oligopeptide/nickel transport system permease component